MKRLTMAIGQPSRWLLSDLIDLNCNLLSHQLLKQVVGVMG